jgi:hypothetical protein
MPPLAQHVETRLPSSPQATASPSITQDREGRPATVSAISGNQIISRTAVEPHLGAILAGDDPEAIVLDFVRPQRAGRRRRGFGRQARRDEADGKHTIGHGSRGNARSRLEQVPIITRCRAECYSGDGSLLGWRGHDLCWSPLLSHAGACGKWFKSRKPIPASSIGARSLWYVVGH